MSSIHWTVIAVAMAISSAVRGPWGGDSREVVPDAGIGRTAEGARGTLAASPERAPTGPDDAYISR
ncbi:hypothetical protein [Actinomadura macra]|uniref:hypothetical protein n=1 Tax=Actinomadura macra TaxID=46164 RepID=UPI0008370C09|nr:hypothetical protein [Actinomadura macra]